MLMRLLFVYKFKSVILRLGAESVLPVLEHALAVLEHAAAVLEHDVAVSLCPSLPSWLLQSSIYIQQT